MKSFLDKKLILVNFIKFFQNWNHIIFILFLVDIFLIFHTFFCGFKYIEKEILFGLLNSFVFYYLVVYIPRYINKKNSKKVFFEYYESFKEDLIRDVLELTNFNDIPLMDDKIRELKKPSNFLKFWREKNEANNSSNTNAAIFVENITNEEYKHNVLSIVNKINELRKEVDFFVHSVSINDFELLKRFRNLDRVFQDGRIKSNLDWEGKEDEEFARTINEILSGWSLSEGQGEEDFIKKWIEKS